MFSPSSWRRAVQGSSPSPSGSSSSELRQRSGQQSPPQACADASSKAAAAAAGTGSKTPSTPQSPGSPRAQAPERPNSMWGLQSPKHELHEKAPANQQAGQHGEARARAGSAGPCVWEERCGPKRVALIRAGEDHNRAVRTAPTKGATVGKATKSTLYDLFVPEGYPNSVRDGYMQFQAFDSLQALCSYLRGVLSTRAILEGLGVGHRSASALAATTQWVYRDGVGMFGGLIFAWNNAPYFDLNVKRWRLFADVAVDLALTLELASPLLCANATDLCFTGAVCTANVLKAACGVAAGATRAVITVHFARNGNTADVQAKEGSQETAVNLLGMIMGLWLAEFVERHQAWVWLVFVFLTALHLIANYFAVQSLRLITINLPRLNVLLSRVLNSSNPNLNVASVNAEESILFDRGLCIEIGCALPGKEVSDNEQINGMVLDKLRRGPCARIQPRKGDESFVQLALRADATTRDILAAIYDEAVPKPRRWEPETFVDALASAGWRVDSNLGLRDHKVRYARTRDE